MIYHKKVLAFISSVIPLFLFITTPPPLTGKQYRKMESKYPEGGQWQSVLHHQRTFNVPLLKINSVETAVSFNVASHPQDTVLLACYLD